VSLARPHASGIIVGMPKKTLLPYDMFDIEHNAAEARRYVKLESIYHRGQDLIWDGKDVLAELVAKHGKPQIPADQVPALRKILGQVMWGELAAWKIALQLADELEPLEARLAATSQAHDEARHFYVFRDYLELATGSVPKEVSPATERLLKLALHSNSMPKKILAMQLQIEATALTIFHALRESNLCPVLSDLMIYFEKDEARHVGLGTQMLPGMLAKMSVPERLAFTGHSIRVGLASVMSMASVDKDLITLGIDPRRMLVLGKSKQMAVFDQLFKGAPGLQDQRGDYVGNIIDALAEGLWPSPGTEGSLTLRAERIWQTYKNGLDVTETVLDPTEAPVMPVGRASLLN